MIVDDEYGVIVSAEVGEIVWDDLTGQHAPIERIEKDKHGNIGYYLGGGAADWCEGGRFPWEIWPPRESKP